MSDKGANLELKNESYERDIKELKKEVTRLESLIVKLEGRVNMQTELMKKNRQLRRKK